MTKQEKLRLSVAICTWNRAEMLDGCLASLTDQELGEPFEIVVVDDGSTDATAATVRRHAAHSVHDVRYVVQAHAGLNAARNRGVAETRGSVIHFLDDDELVPRGHLARVLRRLGQHPRVDGVGGPCRDHGDGPRVCDQCTLAAVDVPGEGLRGTPRLLGGNMAIRRPVFDEVGLFHEDLSGRGDESEWFHRAAGHRFLQDPDLWVWHRRDAMSLTELCRVSFRQGKALPRAELLQGRSFRFRPITVARYVTHGILRRCAKGWWLAARDLGAWAGQLGMRCGTGSHRGARST